MASNSWSCVACTFLNDVLSIKCDICRTPRPQSFGKITEKVLSIDYIKELNKMVKQNPHQISIGIRQISKENKQVK